MSKVEITFIIKDASYAIVQDVEETLELLPYGGGNWMRVRNKDSQITGEGENLTFAVLDYLKYRTSASQRSS